MQPYGSGSISGDPHGWLFLGAPPDHPGPKDNKGNLASADILPSCPVLSSPLIPLPLPCDCSLLLVVLLTAHLMSTSPTQS